MESRRTSLTLYFSLLLITMINMMLELLITRVFSVVAWYHFSFMAISIALFGMTAGAVYVYLKTDRFSMDKLPRSLFHYTMYFAMSLLFLIFLLMSVPFIPGSSVQSLVSMTFTFAGISIPFFYAGVLVCVLLTKYLSKIGYMYFFDLVGAAFGCLLFVPLMDEMDPMSLILLLTALAFAAAFMLRPSGTSKTTTFAVALLALITLSGTFVNLQQNFFRVTWVRGHMEPEPPYKKWNSFSRVIVKPYTKRPFGWGLSREYLKLNKEVPQKLVVIDSSAGTVMTKFDGNKAALEHLKWDVTNIVHYLRKDASVAIIGAGGGRDILSALVFDQKKILGVEINHDVLNALVNAFGAYTGHLNQYPQVTLVNDEARSYITRQKKDFDIIQSSLIDTYAASSSGAFALTENGLYTVESWNTFLDHLSENGVLTFSRWWRTRLDGEMFRLTALASATLEKRGITDIHRHMFLIRGNKTGTVLLSKKPFSQEDENRVREICSKMKFSYILGPTQNAIPEYMAITVPQTRKQLESRIPITLNPPTDNKPFFFQILKPGHLFDWDEAKKYETNSNITAILVLFICLGIVLIFCIATIVVPLGIKSKKQKSNPGPSLRWGILYFSAIGLAFMLVEISQLNVLSTFLGHPTYGLTTVLFSLLISSGLGSLASQKISISRTDPHSGKWIRTVFMLLTAILLIYSLAAPYIWTAFRSSSTSVRVVIAVFMMSLIGFFMGMAFPIGMKVAGIGKQSHTQWYWGINGAMSTLSSVLSTILCIIMGLQFTLMLGWIMYILAGLSLVMFYKTIRTAAVQA